LRDGGEKMGPKTTGRGSGETQTRKRDGKDNAVCSQGSTLNGCGSKPPGEKNRKGRGGRESRGGAHEGEKAGGVRVQGRQQARC